MKNRVVLAAILAIVIIGTALGLYIKMTAQPDITTYLKERLNQQNVPIAKITILQQSPMHLQIVIQSKRNGEKAMPEDPINGALARREVILANQRGYAVERLIVFFLNNQGEPIGKSDELVRNQHPSFNASSASIDNTTTKSLISEKINLYGMSITSLDVTSEDGMQFVTLKLSTPSLETANQAIVSFMDSLQPLLTDLKAQGAQIATFRLEIKDGQGNILITYLIDAQTNAESGWMTEGLAFPVPPPSPE